jgi:hypothetical protein
MFLCIICCRQLYFMHLSHVLLHQWPIILIMCCCVEVLVVGRIGAFNNQSVICCCVSICIRSDHDGFACSESTEISNLSLSLCDEYHHTDSGSKLSHQFCCRGAPNSLATQMRFVLCWSYFCVRWYARWCVAVFHRGHETEFVERKETARWPDSCENPYRARAPKRLI